MALMRYDNAYKGRDWHYNCGVEFLCKPGERCKELIERAWKYGSVPGFVNDEMCVIEAGEDMGDRSPLRTLDRKWNAIPDRTPVETAEIIAFHARPNRIAQLLRYQLDYPAKFPRVAPTKPYFRPGTHDQGIFACVTVNDEYGLRGMNLGAKDVCVDIGTHIGSFVVSAVTAGAGFVAGVEADPTNWTVAKWNVDAYLGRDVAAQKSFIFEGAAWRSDSKKALEEDAKKWTHAGYTDNTGGGGMVPRTDGTKCNFIAFDDIVDLARSKSPSGRVRLLKMDCEGGEYACLYTSKRLKHVDEIRMEFHERADCPFGVGTADGLIAFLGKHGFKLTKRVNTAPALGLMYFAR
jgi:FkbM family methyltransferase